MGVTSDLVRGPMSATEEFRREGPATEEEGEEEEEAVSIKPAALAAWRDGFAGGGGSGRAAPGASAALSPGGPAVATVE